VNSYEIIVTPDAEADLHEIRDYIAETLLVPDVALKYIRVIRKEMEKLSYMADSLHRRNVSRGTPEACVKSWRRTSTSTTARMKYQEGSTS
jgi:plasmid stabilization system protein ParE